MEEQVELRPSPVRLVNFNRSWHPERILGRDWRTAIPFILPVVLIMGGLILYPFINALSLSFTTRSLVTRTEQFVGLNNYFRLLRDSDFLSAVSNTFTFTFASVAIKLVVGMIVALLLNSRLPFRNVLTGLMLLPWIVPEVVTALTWRSIYDPIFGGLNPILQGLGLINRPIAWLADPSLAMPSVIAVNVWKGIPFFTILLLAGLKAIDGEQYEAAQVDGANALQRFRHITLPGLRNVFIVTTLLSFIATFNTFGLIYLMTGGGPGGATRLYSILAYEIAIVGLRFGPGIAIAFSMAPMMMLLIFVLARFMRRDDHIQVLERESRFERLMGWFGRAFSLLLDLVFMTVDWLWQTAGRLLKRLIPVLRTRPLHLTRQESQSIGTGLRMLLMLPLLLFVMFPFYWIFITSFKTDLQIQQLSSMFWPEPWTLDQYKLLLFESPFPTWFYNTAIVAISSTAISIAIASLAAYALARLKFTGAGLLTTVLLVTYLLPASFLFIPLYRILTNLGIINTRAALYLTYPTFLIPFATWVLMGYFRSIPAELEEAAMIDGVNRFGAFWRITLPLAAPGLLSVTLFAFTNAWNEFLYAFVFITSDNLKTLPVGLQLLVFGDIYPWGRLMAASLLMAVPVVIVYIVAQRFLVEGLTAGSVKG